MQLPNVISTLIETQNNSNHEAHSECFSETAVVFDEGRNHHGRQEIKDWAAETKAKYNTRVEPLKFGQDGNKAELSVRVTGTFPGSPVEMTYFMEIENDQIQSLRIS